MKLLFKATPGVERVQTRLRNEVEEIDIVTENRSDDALWQRDASPCLLGECKNWSSKCGPDQLASFVLKLEAKNARATTGFFFSTGGFTDAFRTRLEQRRTEPTLIIPVDSVDLERWIEAEDRLAVLTELHKQAVFGSA